MSKNGNNQSINAVNLDDLKQKILSDSDYEDEKNKAMKQLIGVLTNINKKSSLEEYFEYNNDNQAYFLGEFINYIIEDLLNDVDKKENIKDIKLDVLLQILKLFINFHDKNYPSIFEKIRNIFNFFQNNHNQNLLFDNYIYNKKSKNLFQKLDDVDILLNNNNFDSFIDKSSWVQGNVIDIKGGLYNISCFGGISRINIPIGSSKIRPQREKTKDWEWRNNLLKYDLVDVYNKGKWWPCTICNIIEELNNNNTKIIKYKIGFRLYTNHFKNEEDPNDTINNYISFWKDNTKYLDNNNQEFIGDNIDKDQIIVHYSRRIQKFNTYSKIQKESDDKGDKSIIDKANEELVKDDIEENDNLYGKYNENNIIIEDYLTNFICLLKKMEKDGNFKELINILKQDINTEEIFTILNILSNSFNCIHPNFFEENKEIITTGVINYLYNIDNNEFKNLSKDLIQLIKDFIEKLYDDEDNNIKEIDKKKEIFLIISFKNIHIKKDEEKEIKSINDVIYMFKNNEKELIKLSDIIKKGNIILTLFDPSTDIKIITLLNEILKLLMKYKKLEEKEIKSIVIYEQSKNDNETYLLLFLNLLLELLSIIDESYIGMIMNNFLNNEPKYLNEVDYVFKLSLITKDNENKNKICKYLCKEILILNKFKKDDVIFKYFVNIMKKKEIYLIMSLKICEENINNNHNTLASFSMIRELINQFVTINQEKQPPYIYKKDCLIDYFKDEHLINIFENNFANYIRLARENDKSFNSNEILIDEFKHSENIRERLFFLKSILMMVYPNYNYISSLKKVLFDNPAFPDDINYFYNYLKSNYFLNNNNDMKKEVMNLFKLIAKKEQKKITFPGIQFFMEFFLYLNNDKLDYKKTDNEFEEYKIKLKENVNYNEIRKIKYLWNIVSQVKNKKIIKYLINIIYQIVPRENFVTNIDDKLENENERDNYQQYYELLILFLIESEKYNIIGIKPHYSLLKNYIIKIPLEIKNEKNNQNIIGLFYDNTSLNEVKQELMKNYYIPIEFIETFIYKNNKYIKLDSTNNNKSLNEILIIDDIFKKKENNKKNINIKNLIYFTKKEETEDLIVLNELSPKFKDILNQMFGKLTRNSGKIDLINCINIISSFTISNNKNEFEEKIKLIFEKYDKIGTGFLTLENFYHFFLDWLLKNDNDKSIWENLYKMGYDKYLRKKDEYINNKPVDKSKLFKYNKEVFEEFNEYYNDYPEKNFDFMFFLPTNEEIYGEILSNFNSDPNLFNEIFKNKRNILKQLYYLIIIESIIQDNELKHINPKEIFLKTNNTELIFYLNKNNPFDNININKKKIFLEDFIKHSYIKLIEYNIIILKKYKKNKNKALKECCIKGLKIITIIYNAFLDNKPKQNLLIKDDIYYLDYSHLGNELNKCSELKTIVLNINYKDLIISLIDCLLINNNIEKNEDILLNDYIIKLIKIFMPFDDKLLIGFISDEKAKQLIYELIKNLINENSLISKRFNILSNLNIIISNLFTSDNRLIDFYGDIIKLKLSSYLQNNYLLSSSKEFFDFLNQINDFIFNNKKDSCINILIYIVEILIKDINIKDDEKKFPSEAFIKLMEIIIKSVEKNSLIKKQISSYQLNNESFFSAILEKILFYNNNNMNNDNYNYNFILIEENNNFLYKDLKKICSNYIFQCIEDENDPNTIKNIIKINNIMKESIKDDLSKKGILNNQNNKIIIDYQLLINNINSCINNINSQSYMNVIIQQLLMVPSFRYAIMSLYIKENKKSSSSQKNEQKQLNFVIQLQVMFTRLALGEKKYNPEYFYSLYHYINKNSNNSFFNNDCKEFYNNFCVIAQEYLKPTKYKYIIKDIFFGKTCTSIKCMECQNISNKLEDFYCLTLDINFIKKLENSLRKFIAREIIKDYKCDYCNKKVKIEKRVSLCKLPNILVIHLNRFYVDYEYNKLKKISSNYEFPSKMNFKEFCVENFQKELDDIYFKNNEYYEYILKGVIIHDGDVENGNYFSLIDTCRDGKEDIMNIHQNWIKFNNSNINIIDISKVCQEEISLKNAYLLIYEKVKKTPIKVLIDKKNISENNRKYVINFKANNENNINKKYDISKLNNDINKEELYKTIFHNINNNEFYKYIPYYNIPKICPKALYNQIMKENDSIINRNNKNIINEDYRIKFKDKFYSLIVNQNFTQNIQFYSVNEKNDIVNIIIFDIFQKCKTNNLTKEEKININDKMNIFLINILQPLINEDANINILENIQKSLLTIDNVKIIFSTGYAVLNKNIIKLIYELVKKLIHILSIKKYELQLLYIFEIMKNNLIYSDYKGSNKSDAITYFYDIINDLISNNINLSKKCIKEKILLILLRNIQKEDKCNQIVILNMIKRLIKITADYNSKLFYLEEDKKINEEFKYKDEIKALLNYELIELIFENNEDLLHILIKILQYQDKNYSDNFNIYHLPPLMEYAIKNNKLINYIKFCYNIIDMKDEFCIERMKQIIGFPTMIIKPLLYKDQSQNQRWPLFGAKLIKYNNNNLKTEIYRYRSCYNKKKLCILSYLLPYSGELNTKNKDKLVKLNDENIRMLSYELILKCLSKGTNYCIFKYLYLLPARSLYYSNAYEELINIIKNNSSYNIDELKEIESLFVQKIKYDLNEAHKKSNPNIKSKIINNPQLPQKILQYYQDIKTVNEFKGFIPDFIPDEIIKEKIDILVNQKYLQLIRIEYFTHYYDINEFKNIINNKDNKNIETEIISYDFQKDEHSFINDIKKKFEIINTIINKNGTIKGKRKVMSSLIRYILINNKPINNKMLVFIKFDSEANKKVLDNICLPELVIDYVDRHSYIDFLDINKIKKDELFLKIDDFFMRIDSKVYFHS